MCGDIDEDTGHDDAIFRRFVELARRYGAGPGEPTHRLAQDLTDPQGRGEYMSGLFHDALNRALGDAAAAPDGVRSDAIASQAIVFARLAGFLAAQLPPGADLFRSAMEAFMDGHGELAQSRPDHHHHGHSHDHDH